MQYTFKNTKYTSHSYCALSPQPEIKPFLLLFGGPCLVLWVKSLDEIPRISPGIYNALKWMHWLNANDESYVKASPSYKCSSSSPRLAPWTLCLTPSLEATWLESLWILPLYYSGTQKEGVMELGYMSHTCPRANLEPYCFPCYFFHNPYTERPGTAT